MKKLLLIALLFMNPIVSYGQDAGRDIEHFHATLLEAMQLDSQTEREALLQPVVEATFDTKNIARISLGQTWRDLDETQREAFRTLLAELIVATYADRFDSFNGQQFVTDEIQDLKRTTVVRTRILRSAEDPVRLDYFLRGNRIFNVVANGVSDLSLRKAEYNSVVKNEGYEALLEHIRQKLAQARETT